MDRGTASASQVGGAPKQGDTGAAQQVHPACPPCSALLPAPPCSERNPNQEREGRAPVTRGHTAQTPPVQRDSRPDFSACQYAAPLKW